MYIISELLHKEEFYMSEMSPEASAAAESAALAVEHAQEEQETRGAATAALDNSEAAAVVSEIAAENAAQALDNASVAGESAAIATIAASDAAETANAAGQVAQETQSELAQLREELWGKLDEIKAAVKPPETPNTVVEVGTEHLHGNQDAESGTGGKSEDGDSGDGGEDTGTASKKASRTPAKRGFNRGRRR